MNVFFVLCTILFAAACTTPSPVTAKAPDGFATFSAARDDAAILRALSASGVVYRVRAEKHEPKTEMSFWREALAKKLEGEGYLVQETRDFTMAGRPGGLLHAVAPTSGGDYGFLVAFAPTATGDDIIIAESAGPREDMEKLKPQILSAIAGIADR